MEAEYLEFKGIKFEEIYVDKDPRAAEEMIAEPGQMGVPFTVVSGVKNTKVAI